ncbi:MAG: hypothetical protein R3E96_11060 [Planctomycetota bacterium]
MSIGIDYRPALVNREGTGRYVRELVRAMLFDGPSPELTLFGGTLAPAKYSRYQLGLLDTRVRW